MGGWTQGHSVKRDSENPCGSLELTAGARDSSQNRWRRSSPSTLRTTASLRDDLDLWIELGVPNGQASFRLEELSQLRQLLDCLLDRIAAGPADRLDVECFAAEMK